MKVKGLVMKFETCQLIPVKKLSFRQHPVPKLKEL